MMFLEKFWLYFKKVPHSIEDNEKIVKIIFSPLYYNDKTNKLKANAFRCKNDDSSVNRLEYTTLNLCKQQGLKLSKEAESKNFRGKNFCGIALLFAVEIRRLAELVYKPVKGNKSHAEIVTGFGVQQPGEERPAEYNYLTDQLAKNSRIFLDTDLSKKRWSTDTRPILNCRL